MKTISYHHVEKVELGPVLNFLQESTGLPFYYRKLVIRMEDGTTEEIGLYSADGYSLVSEDTEHQQLLRAA